MRKLQTATDTKDANLPSYSIAAEHQIPAKFSPHFMYFTPDNSDKKPLWMVIRAEMELKIALKSSFPFLLKILKK